MQVSLPAPRNLSLTAKINPRRSQWPRGLRRGSGTARLFRLWVRFPPGAWISVYWACCVLSGRGRAHHASRGVLPNVVRRCVWPRNLMNEDALAHWGLLYKNNSSTLYIQIKFLPYREHSVLPWEGTHGERCIEYNCQLYLRTHGIPKRTVWAGCTVRVKVTVRLTVGQSISQSVGQSWSRTRPGA